MSFHSDENGLDHLRAEGTYYGGSINRELALIQPRALILGSDRRQLL